MFSMKIFVFRAGGSLKAALCCAVALALVGLTAAFACDSLFLPPKQAFCASNGRSLPIYSVQTPEKKAAIGINCAWDDRDILPMLSTLQQNGVRATFFLLGEWAQKYPDAARTIARAGQEIGSHSNSHRDMDTLSQEEILQEIHLSCQNIHAACGQTPVLFRPPSGAYNDLVIDCIHRSGCIPIQWDLDTLDWQGLSAQEIEQRVRRQLAPGSILLLHAGVEYSAQALPLILNVAQEMGYQLFPVGELIDPASSCVDPSGRQLPAQS